MKAAPVHPDPVHPPVQADHPRKVRRLLPTVRVRLTALYGGLFFLAGTLLITVIYLWFQQRTATARTVSVGTEAGTPLGSRPPVVGPLPSLPGQWQHSAVQPPNIVPGAVTDAIARYRHEMLQELMTVSGIALALLVLLAMLLGWWMAGHVLRPVHAITTTARRLSWENLHERIALTGPRDEFKELADTFDDLLDRLHNAFSSQRRFIANASHELRTPLTIQRAAIQIGLADTSPSPDSLNTVRQQLLDANRRAERLIDGLLLLAQGEQGLTHREPVALDEVAAEVARQHESVATASGVTVDLDLHPVSVLGDPVLLTHLVTNLVQNAIRHNHRGGALQIRTSPHGGLVVHNSGPYVPADTLPELFEPFRRGVTARTGSTQGAGLGLSIVRSIAQVHAGTVTARPNPDGGLEVHVSLPQLPTVAIGTRIPQPAPAGYRSPQTNSPVSPST
ncbi:sensor histidine kinase [Kitasatospora sp. NPDC058218]|uniref:sensor histidine kinase n=1 Tax=Kitasatospora sp. NPDC058218 TaxID=3346385 RepID=UPI0036DC0687